MLPPAGEAPAKRVMRENLRSGHLLVRASPSSVTALAGDRAAPASPAGGSTRRTDLRPSYRETVRVQDRRHHKPEVQPFHCEGPQEARRDPQPAQTDAPALLRIFSLSQKNKKIDGKTYDRHRRKPQDRPEPSEIIPKLEPERIPGNGDRLVGGIGREAEVKQQDQAAGKLDPAGGSKLR